ncbi:preprotein translocase subunit YajC [Arenimonas maotaiensis]|uniref:Sec translocon accessory complex subunit YajC n=1 Tax=Arenimonas maotaiensis TaxID=1446479 RepID=A0A917CDB6_9GAMM|nr:preprotein translocase subunit YajC [Arenimonas maotaiensis]GGF85251.1 preprotein translocase subunit YajC [Arenimonas maotaiensis]
MSLLDLIISPAAAQAAPAQQGSPMSLLIMMVLFFAVFYFMAIRPQMKRAKEHRALLAGLSKGDEVIMAGGIAGRVEELGESFVGVEIADGVKIKVQKNAITAVLPKGSLKSA